MSAVRQSLEIVRRRIDEVGTREPTIQRQGEDRILVQVPGEKNPDSIKRLLGQTAKLTFHLVDLETPLQQALAGNLPPGSELLPSDENGGRPAMQYVVRKRVEVSGESLVDAQPTYYQNQPVVSFRFDSVGGRKFGDVTRDHVGELLAIVLDGKVISAPRIHEPILGGSGIIRGSFTVQEANELAVLLRAGALPAPLEIVEERTVGPDLGADSIEAGKIAGVVGLVLVVALMALYYGLFGLFANVALLVNLVLMIAALSVLQATLTLPGIAGIVLTIGMAVDANVLIFERIREEVRVGRSPMSAIDAGYRRGDAHDHRRQPDDPDRGGAALRVRLGPGARLRGDARHRHHHLDVHRDQPHPAADGDLAAAHAPGHAAGVRRAPCVGFRFIPDDTTIHFMRYERLGYAISAVLILASLVLLPLKGLNFGIDFRGGILIEVRMPGQAADLGGMRADARAASASARWRCRSSASRPTC